MSVLNARSLVKPPGAGQEPEGDDPRPAPYRPGIGVALRQVLERILEDVAVGLEDVRAAVDGPQEGEEVRLVWIAEQIGDRLPVHEMDLEDLLERLRGPVVEVRRAVVDGEQRRGVEAEDAEGCS